MRARLTRGLHTPAAGVAVLLTDPRFVLPPELYLGIGRQLGANFRHFGGEVFQNPPAPVHLRLMAGTGRDLHIRHSVTPLVTHLWLSY